MVEARAQFQNVGPAFFILILNKENRSYLPRGQIQSQIQTKFGFGGNAAYWDYWEWNG